MTNKEILTLGQKSINNLANELADRVNQKHYIEHVLKGIFFLGFQFGYGVAKEIKDEQQPNAASAEEV